ncbi:MAG: Hint domain-containing protein [Rhodobacteraceae bacterium]|nr:Hint domain-containing protein [Paracoccaceae bacterium]
MVTGPSGTFVISWAQTALDGQPADLDDIDVGSAWRWTGRAVRVDGAEAVLDPGAPDGEADLRRRAARVVRRLVGQAITGGAGQPLPPEGEAEETGFVVTDGHRSFTATIIETPATRRHLLMFLGEVPPPDTDLWVVRREQAVATFQNGGVWNSGVICFTPGTLLRTPDGPRRIEALAPGDTVLTRDSGAQEILWIGTRKMTGARLYAMPALRPVRIRAGALGIDRPEPDLVVSPQHRLLVRGAAAQALFNEDEVLVAACDLVNHRSIVVDRGLREVTYIHLMLERHEVLWANGLETESFHPASTSLATVEEDQRRTLLAMMPGLSADPNVYGDYARRALSGSEAAILRAESSMLAA